MPRGDGRCCIFTFISLMCKFTFLRLRPFPFTAFLHTGSSRSSLTYPSPPSTLFSSFLPCRAEHVHTWAEHRGRKRDWFNHLFNVSSPFHLSPEGVDVVLLYTGRVLDILVHRSAPSGLSHKRKESRGEVLFLTKHPVISTHRPRNVSSMMSCC